MPTDNLFLTDCFWPQPETRASAAMTTVIAQKRSTEHRENIGRFLPNGKYFVTDARDMQATGRLGIRNNNKFFTYFLLLKLR
jgi:hypothetical protein